MEKVIKDFNSNSLNGFKVVEDGNLIKSINKQGKVFHFIDLSYKKHGILVHGWEGYRTNEQMKEVFEGHFFDIFKTCNCKKVLTDASKMTGTFAEVNDWLAKTYMPKIIKLGLVASAMCLPSNVFSQMAVEEWDKKSTGFQKRDFGSFNEALNWLKTI